MGENKGDRNSERRVRSKKESASTVELFLNSSRNKIKSS